MTDIRERVLANIQASRDVRTEKAVQRIARYLDRDGISARCAARLAVDALLFGDFIIPTEFSVKAEDA